MTLKYYRNVFLVSLFTIGISGLAIAQTTDDSAKVSVDTLQVQTENTNLIQVGYAKQPTGIVTSAVSSVKGAQIEQNFNINLGNTLFGRLPGLWVAQSNNEPGNGVAQFTVRGKNSYTGSAAPLIIVDGFVSGENEVGSVFSQLVPEEVESVTLLKDAASTAVYGSRGANGVLLITTKRGEAGPVKVSFGTRQGFTQAFALPQFLDAANYATLRNEARLNDNLLPLYNDAAIEAYRTGSDPFNRPNVNWYNEVLRKSAPLSSYNLSFRGGDKIAQYFVLLNAVSAQGLYKKFGDEDPQSANSEYSRYNFRSNLDVNLSKRLSVAFNLGGSIESKLNPGGYTTGNTFNLLQTIPSNAFPVRNPDGSWGGTNLYSGNPVAELLARGSFQSNGRTLQSSLKFTHQLDMLAKGLSVWGAVSMNNYFISGTEISRNYARSFISGSDANGNPVYTIIGQTTAPTAGSPSRTDYRNYEVMGALEYSRTFGKHGFNGLLMGNTINEAKTFTSGSPASASDPYRHNGLATRLTYVYNSKYIAEFSAGYMGTENYSPGKRYGFFPAGSVGWVLSQESFLKNNKTINLLKLRASYGLAGNENHGGERYAYLNIYNPFDGSEITLGNSNYTWEKEKSLNLGFDAKFFNSLDFTVDAFKRNRYDILTNSLSVVPGFMGAQTSPLNVGKTSSRGVDLSLRLTGKQNAALGYFVETNVSHYKNKIDYMSEVARLNPGEVRTGQAIDQPFRYKALGFFTPEEIAQRAADAANNVITQYAAPRGVNVRAGDLRYEDVGGINGKPDGIIDSYDQQPIGNPGNTPRTVIGLNTGVNFKGFDLNAVFQAVTGYSVYLNGPLFQAFQNDGNVSPIALGRWTPETAATASYPRLSSSNSDNNNFLGSSFWERSGSFIKLRSAELGYTLPQSISSKVKIGSARIFINGTNLFSLDKIEYGDPESLGGYPVMQNFVLGAKINL